MPLGGNLLGTQPARTLLPLPEKPYRSLHYYERADRPLFAGRDGDVIRVARMLGDAGTRLLVLHGESGCGKSSFLRPACSRTWRRSASVTAVCAIERRMRKR